MDECNNMIAELRYNTAIILEVFSYDDKTISSYTKQLPQGS